ncbi:MAG: LysM peptidoglycan-binding domain-containing protein [Tissierellia bacterium]|nr:LysM peptidoglycan-binding domain-containing protein [Tissierellia bacterium]
MNYHIVRYEDTIYEIAQMYNISVESILNANPRINPNIITIGQIISIPIESKEKWPLSTSFSSNMNNIYNQYRLY